MAHAGRKNPRYRRYRQVDGDGYPRSGGHIEVAQQVETRQQAADHRAQGITAIQQTPPGNALRGAFNPAHNGGQGCAHEDGGREHTTGRQKTPQQHSTQTIPGGCHIDPVQQRQDYQNQQAEEGNACLQPGVNTQRVLPPLEPGEP